MRRRILLGISLAVVALAALLGWLNRTELKLWVYEGGGRDAWQQPDEVMRALAIAPGARVADIGSGGGYFTFRFARAVGSSGKVYAVDIDEELLRRLGERAQREGLTNIETVLAAPDDPKLPAGGVDLIFLCNTYHHLDHQTDYFRRLRAALAPGGRVALVELRGESWLGKIFGHTTRKDVMLSEIEAAGYRLTQQFDFLPRQHFLIFSAAQTP
jgi:ubiquinone/menaquinone biosynthesis C-methylase UbiE